MTRFNPIDRISDLLNYKPADLLGATKKGRKK
jgi:hypothetical protein